MADDLVDPSRPKRSRSEGSSSSGDEPPVPRRRQGGQVASKEDPAATAAASGAVAKSIASACAEVRGLFVESEMVVGPISLRAGSGLTKEGLTRLAQQAAGDGLVALLEPTGRDVVYVHVRRRTPPLGKEVQRWLASALLQWDADEEASAHREAAAVEWSFLSTAAAVSATQQAAAMGLHTSAIACVELFDGAKSYGFTLSPVPIAASSVPAAAVAQKAPPAGDDVLAQEEAPQTNRRSDAVDEADDDSAPSSQTMPPPTLSPSALVAVGTSEAGDDQVGSTLPSALPGGAYTTSAAKDGRGNTNTTAAAAAGSKNPNFALVLSRIPAIFHQTLSAIEQFGSTPSLSRQESALRMYVKNMTPQVAKIIAMYLPVRYELTRGSGLVYFRRGVRQVLAPYVKWASFLFKGGTGKLPAGLTVPEEELIFLLEEENLLFELKEIEQAWAYVYVKNEGKIIEDGPTPLGKLCANGVDPASVVGPLSVLSLVLRRSQPNPNLVLNEGYTLLYSPKGREAPTPREEWDLRAVCKKLAEAPEKLELPLAVSKTVTAAMLNRIIASNPDWVSHGLHAEVKGVSKAPNGSELEMTVFRQAKEFRFYAPRLAALRSEAPGVVQVVVPNPTAVLAKELDACAMEYDLAVKTVRDGKRSKAVVTRRERVVVAIQSPPPQSTTAAPGSHYHHHHHLLHHPLPPPQLSNHLLQPPDQHHMLHHHHHHHQQQQAVSSAWHFQQQQHQPHAYLPPNSNSNGGVVVGSRGGVVVGGTVQQQQQQQQQQQHCREMPPEAMRALYQRVAEGQAFLPPGWTCRYSEGAQHYVLFDHLSRKCYRADALDAQQQFGNHIHFGLTQVRACVERQALLHPGFGGMGLFQGQAPPPQQQELPRHMDPAMLGYV